MNDAPAQVAVRLMGAEYRVACPPGELDDLQAAAAFFDERLNEIRSSGRVSGPERVAVMAGLNLAYELLRLRRDSEAAAHLTGATLGRLLARVETSLSKTDETPL